MGAFKFCHNCGERLEASDMFCISCGTLQETEEEQGWEQPSAPISTGGIGEQRVPPHAQPQSTRDRARVQGNPDARIALAIDYLHRALAVLGEDDGGLSQSIGQSITTRRQNTPLNRAVRNVVQSANRLSRTKRSQAAFYGYAPQGEELPENGIADAGEREDFAQGQEELGLANTEQGDIGNDEVLDAEGEDISQDGNAYENDIREGNGYNEEMEAVNEDGGETDAEYDEDDGNNQDDDDTDVDDVEDDDSGSFFDFLGDDDD